MHTVEKRGGTKMKKQKFLSKKKLVKTTTISTVLFIAATLILSSAVSAASVSSTTTVSNNVNKEYSIPTVPVISVKELTIDAAPNPGSGPSAPTRAPGDILIDFDAQTVHTETGSLGAEWDGTYLWSSCRGLVNPTHMFFVWSTAGALITSYAQPAQASTWGIRDLAFDGTDLYGGSENGFWKINPSSGATTLMFSSISPMTCIRALAWEPNAGKFWSGNFATAFYNFDPAGTTITTVTNPGLTAVYGMAYDDFGDKIWIFDQSGTPATTMYEYNYITNTLTGTTWVIPLLTGSTAASAGGCFYAEDLVTGKAVLGGMTQGTPVDRIFGMELRDVVTGEHDVGVSKINSPADGPAAGIITPECTVKNYGNDTEVTDVQMTISKGAAGTTYINEDFTTWLPTGWTTNTWAQSFTGNAGGCLLYTSPSPRDQRGSRMPSSA